MNATQCMKIASDAVTVSGYGTSWTVTHPFYHDDVQGPSTCSHATSYAAAMVTAGHIKATIATTYYGCNESEIYGAAFDIDDGIGWREAVRKAAKRVRDYQARHAL